MADEVNNIKMLKIRPISLKDANSFVEQNHRHHSPVQGHKFSIAAYNGEILVGVCIVGRPVCRHLDDGNTLEVTRLCTDGTKNACSILYARAAKIAKEMGYIKIITYTLESESGVSLKASGWTMEKQDAGGEIGMYRVGHGNWCRNSYPFFRKNRNTLWKRKSAGASSLFKNNINGN